MSKRADVPSPRATDPAVDIGGRDGGRHRRARRVRGGCAVRRGGVRRGAPKRVAVIGGSLAAGLGPPDGSPWPWLVARDTGVEDESVQTSAALEGAVVGAGGVWVDLGDPLRGREQFVQDDLEHPTEAGQRALARAVERELAAAGITL